MPRQFRGKTEDAEAPFLGAEFWKKGVKIAGVVTRVFETQLDEGKRGVCYVVRLVEPMELAGEEVEEVSVGNLTGFLMAMQGAKVSALLPNDKLYLECTGVKEARKPGFSPRINFALEVTRP